ncbi:MAG TPA: hypothetical protein VH684_25745 [Xanthobacteraceae bacterium]|jgi:excisionase family DNA binding protein
MSYSLQQAASAAGVNKSTILRAIRAGKVSATRDEHRQWLIEPAELHRVYAPAVARNGKVNGESNGAHQAELAEANQRASAAEREAVLLRATIEDLRSDRDAWREQAQRLALPAPTPAGWSWWRRRSRPSTERVAA